jgi:hypothetical protein
VQNPRRSPQPHSEVEFARVDPRNVIILTAMQLETRAVTRALSDLPCDVLTIGICACRMPTDLPTDGKVVILAGLAGALDPTLKVGDVVLDDPKGIIPASVGFRRGAIYTANQIIPTPADKAALFQRTGALAVDMETDLVRRLPVPVVTVRTISDSAAEVLDSRVIGFVDEVGRSRPLKIAATLLRQPALIPYLRRLEKNSKFAAERLGSAVRSILEIGS